MQVIRHGGFAPATRTHPRPFGMPPTGLNHQELADVTTYIRQSWGNRAGAVTVLEAMRAR
jgi:mono/diheme cytochrome c family protein